jgi:hypothetical protein
MHCTKLQQKGKLNEALELFERTVAVLNEADPKHKGVSMMKASIDDLNRKLKQRDRADKN